MQLTYVLTKSIKQTGLEINTSTKKNLRRKIEMQFSYFIGNVSEQQRKSGGYP